MILPRLSNPYAPARTVQAPDILLYTVGRYARISYLIGTHALHRCWILKRNRVVFKTACKVDAKSLCEHTHNLCINVYVALFYAPFEAKCML